MNYDSSDFAGGVPMNEQQSLFLEISIKDSEIIWIIKCYQKH